MSVRRLEVTVFELARVIGAAVRMIERHYVVGENIGSNSDGLAMRWNGSRWRVYRLRRSPGSDVIELHSIAPVDADDMRIVGMASATPLRCDRLLRTAEKSDRSH